MNVRPAGRKLPRSLPAQVVGRGRCATYREGGMMAKYCQSCGRKLSLFASGTLCKDCMAAEKAQEAERQGRFSDRVRTIQAEVVANKDVTEDQMEFLRLLDRPRRVDFYSAVYDELEADNELAQTEVDTLKKVQEGLGLSDEEVRYEERVRPYIYVLSVKTTGSLPTVNLEVVGGSPVVLKKGEVVHFADRAILKEVKSVSLGYKGGSHGVSIPIGYGVRYRVGSHRGHIQREDRLLETSRGALVVTNQRLLLHPSPGQKPLSIPLTKILSYQCFGNGIEVYKDGREKGYFLSINNSSSVELFGLCLGHLLAQN